MDDLLTPVKTVRNVRSNIEKFETLSVRDSQGQNGVSTRQAIPDLPDATNGSSNPPKNHKGGQSLTDNAHTAQDLTWSGHGQSRNEEEEEGGQPNRETILSPEQALAILQKQLSEERLEAVLQYLEKGIQRKHPFNLHIPTASAAQILQVLVSTVIPDRWAALHSTAASPADRAIGKSLVSCVNSTAGIGALTARIQHLSTLSQMRQPGSSHCAVFTETVSFFDRIVHHKTFLRDLLYRTQSSGDKPGQQQALWAEATSLFAGSKILNVFQQASMVSELKSEIPSWLQDPREYSEWLGMNMAVGAIGIAPALEEAWKMLANFLKRALSLGHKGRLNIGLRISIS